MGFLDYLLQGLPYAAMILMLPIWKRYRRTAIFFSASFVIVLAFRCIVL
jgi:hypothetical protein